MLLYEKFVYVIFLVACYLIAMNVLRKNPGKRDNRMLCASFILLGSFGTSILIYGIFNDVIVIYIFSRLAYVCAGFSMFLLYLVFGAIAYSKDWIRTRFAPYLITLVVFSIAFFAWPEAVIITDPSESATQMNEVMIGILMLLMIIFLVSTLVYLLKYGIAKTEGQRKSRMKEVFVGVLLSLLALVFGAIGNFFTDLMASVFDALFLATLVLSIYVIGRGFIKSSE